MARGLLIIDIQRDYFPGGAYPLIGPEAAASSARRLLDEFRASGEPVVHLKHLSSPEDPFLRPGTEGVEIHPVVAPADDETVIEKHSPNGFIETNLDEVLRSSGVDDLVVAGMMSSMCVDATVRAAVDQGFSATVVHDACAAPDLHFDGTKVPGAEVHAAFMAALSQGYARVVDADTLLTT
ncbi:MAG TPA: cysteine hydrolase family protein [Solirubrobacteraceae bacterium]|nr:cysteine hydrolase family protein [Solirubrobacteraceae bacterium]